MDEFSKKREMIQTLMKMLKHNASDEVSNGMKGPHMTDLTKANSKMAQPTSDSSMMADGGMAEVSDEPMREMPSELPSEDVSNPALSNLPAVPEDEEAEKDSLQTEHNVNMMDEDEDNNSSAFAAFLPRKKKK